MWMTEKTIQKAMFPLPNTWGGRQKRSGGWRAATPSRARPRRAPALTTPTTEKKMTTARQA